MCFDKQHSIKVVTLFSIISIFYVHCDICRERITYVLVYLLFIESAENHKLCSRCVNGDCFIFQWKRRNL